MFPYRVMSVNPALRLILVSSQGSFSNKDQHTITLTFKALTFRSSYNALKILKIINLTFQTNCRSLNI